MSSLVQHSCRHGWRAVSIDMRLGTQIGDGQIAPSNATPSAARPSRFGVATTGSP